MIEAGQLELAQPRGVEVDVDGGVRSFPAAVREPSVEGLRIAFGADKPERELHNILKKSFQTS